MVKFTVTFKLDNGNFDSKTFDGLFGLVEAEGFAFEGFVNGDFEVLAPACIVVEDDERFLKKLIRVIEPNLVFDEDGAMDISGFTVKGSALY